MGALMASRSSAARASPRLLTIRDRASAERSGGKPRIRPVGRGRRAPRATTEAELVAGATRSSPIAS